MSLTISIVTFLTEVSPVAGSIVKASPMADVSAGMEMPEPENTWSLTDLRVPSDFLMASRMTWSAATPSRELADSICEGRWVATGGGGYQPVTVIPRAWSMVWCAVSGRALPDALDEGWRARWQARAREDLPQRFLDDRYEDLREAQAARSNAAMRDALRRVNPRLCG